MLGIHRQDAHAVLLCGAHHQTARTHERLLVRQRNVLARLDGRHRRQQPDHADNRRYHDVRAALRGTGDQTVHAGQNRNIGVCQLDFQRLCCVFIHRADHFRMQGTRLLLQ